MRRALVVGGHDRLALLAAGEYPATVVAPAAASATAGT